MRTEGGVTMERLTKRNCNNFVIPVRGTDAVSILQAIDRLASIEDILGDNYDLERLKEAVKLIDKLERK